MKIKLSLLCLCFFVLASNTFAQQTARKWDEHGELYCDDAKARLDNLAIQLQQEPTAKGYIIFYGGKSYRGSAYNRRLKRYVEVKFLPRRGEAKARMTPWIDYLVNSRGIVSSRVEVIDGGYREEQMMEFWIVPAGAKPPTPTPTLTDKEIKFRKGKIKPGEFECQV